MTPGTDSTVVVELTPPGRAAVAVVLVAGPNALSVVGNCFVPRVQHSVDRTPIGRIVLGRWGGPGGEELIVCRRNEEQIEIHCHGGAAAVEAVVDRLVSQGCKPLAWQDWVRRQSSDPIRAAAQIALADVVTERTAAILIDQLNGALSAAISRTVDEIAAVNWSAAAELLDELLSRRDLGLHLAEPWRVVVFGAPNVGKSSLINSLAGYERAIVSPVPGTTRDVVTLVTAMDGWPVQLADTAGFRATQDELESAGVELATATVAEADLVIFLYDATKLNDELMSGSADLLCSAVVTPVRRIRVVNKIDLITIDARLDLLTRWGDSLPEIANPLLVSALTGEGIAELASTISSVLAPVVPPPGSAIPFTIEQIERLIGARRQSIGTMRKQRPICCKQC